MVACQFDHLVVAAETLQSGIAYVQDALGVTVPFGGRHPLMGTHNALMRLGDKAFLEIIAIDPDGASPQRPRWFNLDDPSFQATLQDSPRLHTWVCRTSDIQAATDVSGISTGPIEEGRRGDLIWQITIPQDGSLPMGGVFPTLIQWPKEAGPDGPAPRMADLGCELEVLQLAHPDPDQLRSALAAISAEDLAQVEKAPIQLLAKIRTPNGIVELR